MPATIRSAVFCLPVCYPKVYTFKYTKYTLLNIQNYTQVLFPASFYARTCFGQLLLPSSENYIIKTPAAYLVSENGKHIFH